MHASGTVPRRYLQGQTPTHPCQQAASVSRLPAPAPHCARRLAHAHPRSAAQSDVRVPLRTELTAGAYRGFFRGCGASPHSLFGWIPGFFCYPIADERVGVDRWSSAKMCTICWLFRVWMCSRRRVLCRACSAALHSDAWCPQSLHDGASDDENCDSKHCANPDRLTRDLSP